MKILSTFLISLLLFINLINPALALAEDLPTPPEMPTVPTQEDKPAPPSMPSRSEEPAQPTMPPKPVDDKPKPTIPPFPEDTPKPAPTQDTSTPNNSNSNNSTPNNQNNSTPSDSPSTNPSPNTATNQTQNGQTGDTTVKTGNATNTATIDNTGNSNASTPTQSTTASDAPGGATVVNSGNGTASENSGSAKVVDTSNTSQTNNANLNNKLSQETLTGNNSASENMGNSSVDSGDANTTGTVINAVNTNVAGVMVSEFNIADDHTGNIILDFGANCISGCSNVGAATAKNTGNGSGSTNSSSVEQLANSSTTQDNNAVLSNGLKLSADSGHNLANDNTGGNTEVTTGDANVAANVLNFANNNVAGNVVYGVVNIFGDLVGDIIFPSDQMAACSSCGGNTTAANTNNGSNSTNTASASGSTNNTTKQNNAADIQNNLNLDAKTSDNKVNDNTGGNSSVSTGDTNVDASVLNVANTNLNGGNWWLVVVNEAGQWVGKIMGAEDGATYAGSEGTAFTVNDLGEVTATNTGNGSNSTNTAAVTTQTNNTTIQNNDAKIDNNLDLSANTGGNSASGNTGGDTSVQTGDATIIASIVNFVNNNIVGDGKLYVTVVNVFGSWLGNLRTPGHENDSEPVAAAQGAAQNSESADSSTQNNSTDSQSTTEKTTKVHVESNKSGLAASVANYLAQVTTKNKTPSNPTGNESQGSVAGITTQESPSPVKSSLVDSAKVTKKSIKINLAWGLLLFPLLGVYILNKKFAFTTKILKRRFA